MRDPALKPVDPHHDAEELLPWYATGQLDGADLALVEQHLSSCAHCRRQLAFERRMIDEFASLDLEVDSGWARLKRRIELQGGRRHQDPWAWIRGQAAGLWRGLRRPAIATFAVAQLAFVVLAGALLLSLGRPDYRALGSAPPSRAANVIAMFRPDTSELQLRKLLQTNGASLVDGPTDADAYLLRVPDASRARVLDRMRANPHVLMAQPIDGANS